MTDRPVEAKKEIGAVANPVRIQRRRTKGWRMPPMNREELLKAFDEGVATVRLDDGPRPLGKSAAWLAGQDIGIRQGLKIARSILEAGTAEPSEDKCPDCGSLGECSPGCPSRLQDDDRTAGTPA
jgi:hypothetical protein